MFARLGGFTFRRRGWVLLAAIVLTALAGAFGPGVADEVKTGGFGDPGSESFGAQEALEDAYGRTAADVVVVWGRADLPATDPAFATEVTAMLAGVPDEAVLRVVHPWTPGLPAEMQAGLLGSDGHSAMAVLSMNGDGEDERRVAYEGIVAALTAPAPWTTDIAGGVGVNEEMQHLAERDIIRAELFAMPVLLILLVLIFGSAVAASLPVGTGVLAILGAMGVLRLITLVTDVSTFALNVTTILGLGLAIDYALFIVSRFREELQQNDDVATAVSRTVATAGRTVAFSGLTVLIAFAGLLFFPQMFLRSMGLGGMAVVLLDMVLALTLLPAVLSILGRRVDAGRMRGGVLARRLPAGLTGMIARRARSAGTERGGWARVARLVLRRPGEVALGATLLLAFLALPALDLHPGQTDIRDMPASAQTRQAVDRIDALFPGNQSAPIDVVVTGRPAADALDAWVVELAAVPDVTDVRLAEVPAEVTHLAVSTEGAVDSPGTRDLVADIRALAPPDGADEVFVGGAAAWNVDNISAIVRTLPATLGFVAGVTLILLFAALGSVVLPLKAVAMNVLSLGATAGVLTWGFGQGHLAGLLDFTGAGRIDPSNIVLIALMAFGLAMDYELFLLSRIREEHLLGADQATAIATGMQRSGRTITNAALLLCVVLAAMATSGLTFLKLIGVGLALAVALDATLVRALLVPATMRLLGRANWWLPAPLARLHRRIGFSEEEVAPAPLVVPERELVGSRA
jgi:RND superfamily putative drug exporter